MRVLIDSIKNNLIRMNELGVSKEVSLILFNTMKVATLLEGSIDGNREVSFEELRDTLDENQMIEAAISYANDNNNQPMLSGFDEWIARAIGE